MISKSHLNLIQGGVAVVLLLVASVTEPGLGRMGLTFLYGLIWLALARRTGLSPVLVSGLVLLAVRLPLTDGLPLVALLAVVLGVGAWTLSLWVADRRTAVASSLLWGGAGICLPGLWPLILCGFPRLGKLHGDHGTWAKTPGMLLWLTGVASLAALHGMPEAFLRPTEQEHYIVLLERIDALFTAERLWVVLPLVGGFEVAQKQPEDLRFTWRNLPVAGAFASFLFLAPSMVLEVMYVVLVPLAAIMLTRWTLALPGWPPRIVLWLGLGIFAWPALTGGLS